jgi:hypothetical protein
VKRALLVVAAAAAALLGALFLRAAGPVLEGEAPLPAASPTAPPVTAVPTLEPPSRNVFRYADQPAAAAGPAPLLVPAAPVVEPPPALQPPPPEPVRLVGLVRRGAAWRAALSINDDVVVLGLGESSGGYELVAIDEAEGVTVRDPQGQERRLPLPEP